MDEKRVANFTVEQLDMLYMAGDIHERIWRILRAETLDSPAPQLVCMNLPIQSFTHHRTAKA